VRAANISSSPKKRGFQAYVLRDIVTKFSGYYSQLAQHVPSYLSLLKPFVYVDIFHIPLSAGVIEIFAKILYNAVLANGFLEPNVCDGI